MATPVVENLDINIAHVQELLQDCMDIVQQEIYLRAGRVFLVYGETTISNVLLDQSVIAELLHQLDTLSVEEQRILLTKKGITAGKSKQFATIEEALCVLFTFIWARIAARFANSAKPETLNRATGVVLVILGIVLIAFKVL